MMRLKTSPKVTVRGISDVSLFLPLPIADSLSTLLAKHVPNPRERPPRDVSGDWQHTDFHTLVMTGSWRALARMARDQIVTAEPDDLNFILGMWYLRLSCLARMRLYNQASAECSNLFALLETVEPQELRHQVFDHLLPFELEVFRTRLFLWANDPLSYLDALYALLAKCKRNARDAIEPALEDTWAERSARITLIIASQLIDMKEYITASSILSSMASNGSAELKSTTAHLYLQMGHLQIADQLINQVEADQQASPWLKRLNEALRALCFGDLDLAIAYFNRTLELEPDNIVALNNLSVALISSGKVKQSIEVLERAMQISPSTVLCVEPYLFNLATVYELRSTTAAEKKVSLLVETAKWSGDGLRASALKLG